MKKVFILWDNMNEMGFGIEAEVDETNIEKAKELIVKGYDGWHDVEGHPEWETVGYAEPSMELLRKEGIEYRLLDDEEITDPNDENEFNAALNPVVYSTFLGYWS